MTRGTLYTGTGTLVIEECCNCGVLFAMPKTVYDDCLRRSSAAPGATRDFYCPNGHSQHYTGKNREQELEEKLQRAQDRAGWAAGRAEQAERREQAQRGAATRARNERDRQARRVKHGVCPCCHRTFKQLAAHMAAKHPDYDGEVTRST